MLNNIKVSTIKQIIIEITTQKCFCMVYLSWVVIFNLEQLFGFLFFSSELLLEFSVLLLRTWINGIVLIKFTKS